MNHSLTLTNESKRKKFYITTPIFYPNSVLHLGHAYTMVITDCIARYKQLDGYEVYLQTGSDEHGEKIIKTSLSCGITPQELVNDNVRAFRKLWKELNIIENHGFVRTSNDQHKQRVQQTFSFLLEKGDVYFSNYQGSYCFVCEDYVMNEKKCGNCGGQLAKISEKAYFLRIEKYRPLLIEYYEKNKNFLLPRSSFNELVHSFLKKEIPDLCITRKSLNWGIAVPGKPKMTIYVWFDALLNYLTSDQGAEFFLANQRETEIVHVIGKDIIRFHGIYWILMLFSLRKRLPNKIIAHGWILKSGSKMSKSKGNVINPFDLLKRYGSDVLRAYLCSKIVLYQDGILNEELFTSFYQDFFVKKLGNLLARTSRMFELYSQGVIPNFKKPTNHLLIIYFERCSEIVSQYKERMNSHSLTAAFANIQEILDLMNKFISEISPWRVFAEVNYQLLEEIMNALANGIRMLSFLLIPFTPDLTKKIMLRFGISHCKMNFESTNLFNFSSVNGQKIRKSSAHFFN